MIFFFYYVLIAGTFAKFEKCESLILLNRLNVWKFKKCERLKVWKVWKFASLNMLKVWTLEKLESLNSLKVWNGRDQILGLFDGQGLCDQGRARLVRTSWAAGHPKLKFLCIFSGQGHCDQGQARHLCTFRAPSWNEPPATSYFLSPADAKWKIAPSRHKNSHPRAQVSYGWLSMGCFWRPKECDAVSKKNSQRGGRHYRNFVVHSFLLPLQKLQSLKVEIVNINDFAHVVKMALQLYDFEDFAIVTDWSFYRVWKFRLDEASGDCILGIQGSRTDFRSCENTVTSSEFWNFFIRLKLALEWFGIKLCSDYVGQVNFQDTWRRC